MSTATVETVAEELRTFDERGRAFGLWEISPLPTIVFLALPVAPSVRLTDLGVVDTVNQRIVDMFSDEPDADQRLSTKKA